MALSQSAVEVFCSYAHEDENYRQQLETHMGALKRQGLVSFWHDRKILPGTNWSEIIDEHLETASIILLLISANFISSDYCYTVEMKRALERHEIDEARVVPIVVRPCDWQYLPIGKLQALPVDMDIKPISMWADVDAAWAHVVAGLRHVIEDLSLLSAGAPRTFLPKIWMIPYPRNFFFLGREDLLSQIHAQLQLGRAAALSQPQAISGLGGIGKTQIAVEYAYRYFHEYQMVLWAHSESIESLTASYVQIAAELNLREKDAQEQKIVVQAVKTWLQGHRNWLLILDNADELELLRGFLPLTVGGHLLITTRASTIGQLARRIEVRIFTKEQGALFLLRRASRLAPDALLTQASEQDQMIAQTISNELGGLPLALDQVGAYLEQTGYSLTDYQQIYQRHRESILRERGELVAEHPEPVATTWSLSFTRVEQKSSVAADVLRLCAFFAAEAIPLDLIVTKVDNAEPKVQDDFELGQVIAILRAYSLVNHDLVTRSLSIHRLIQVVLYNSLSIEERSMWIQRAITLANSAFPYDGLESWQQCERYLPHVLACANWIKQWKIVSSEAAHLLSQTGNYLYARARYTEAEPLYVQALKIYQQMWGTEHSDTTPFLNNLATLYHKQGRYVEAEPLYVQALKIYQQMWGTEHPETTPFLNNLAALYYEQGRYVEAEPLYKQALDICEKQLGLEHPYTAQSLRGLAELYRMQGKYAEAEPLLKQVLSIHEKQSGTEHLDKSHSLNYLALLYYEQGRHTEAEPLYKQALTIRERLLGTEHPDTAQSLNNLATLYYEQGRYIEAEPLYKRALNICEKQLGTRHPDTAQSLSNLATLFTGQGKYTEAVPLYRQALHIYEQILGSEHSDTALSMHNLAALYVLEGRYAEAEPLYKQVLAVWKKQLGVEHPYTKFARDSYAALLQMTGRLAEATKLLEENF